MRKSIAGFLLVLFFCGAGIAEDITLVDWNILNYPGSTGAARDPEFRTVLTDIGPDMLLVQEILSQAGVNSYLANVLNTIEPGQWSAAAFVDGPDTDNALFYRTASFTEVSSGILPTALRNIGWWQMRFNSTGDEFRIYSVHLKASTGSTNEAKRLAECQILRADLDALPAGTSFILGGDLNIYTNTESAYQLLLSAGAGQLNDPINQSGNWHNNAAYALYHTQSPRVTQFGGGANGGMDDRFDQVLASGDLLDGTWLDLLPATYVAYGNDGAHFNQAINAGTNGVVSQAVADAIHNSSDHIPVVVTLSSPAATTVAQIVPVLPSALTVAPNPFNPTTSIRYSVNAPGRVFLGVYDPTGRLITTLTDAVRPEGEFSTTWDGRNDQGRSVAGGVYFAHLRAGGDVTTTKMVLIR